MSSPSRPHRHIYQCRIMEKIVFQKSARPASFPASMDTSIAYTKVLIKNSKLYFRQKKLDLDHFIAKQPIYGHILGAIVILNGWCDCRQP